MGFSDLSRAVLVRAVVPVLLLLAGGCSPDATGDQAVAPSPTTSQDARTLWVAPDGDDSDPGTKQRPFATLAHALGQLDPGERLFVRAGTYRERITDVVITPGRRDAPVVVAAYEDERPVVEGLLWLREPSYWTIDGINVTWSEENDDDEHMVKLTGGEGWSFTGAEVWGARSFAAILVAGADDVGAPRRWRIADNCIHDTHKTNGKNEDQLLYVNTGPGGSGVVERNLLFNATNGEAVKLGGADERSATTKVTVRYNTVHNTVQPILVAWHSRSNEIRRNLLVGADGAYGLIRGFELRGRGNVAADNAGSEAQRFILNDEGYRGVRDGGGNQLVEPEFDETGTCDGFHPRDDVAAEYGRYAPGGGVSR